MHRSPATPHARQMVYRRPFQTARPAVRRSSVPWSMLRLAVLALILGVPLLAIWGSVGMYTYFQAYGLIAPGVYARGVDLGAMPVSRGAAKLDQTWNGERKIEVGRITSQGVQSWLVSPPEIGIRVDALRTAQQAYGVGRGKSAFSNLFGILSGLWTRREVPLGLSFDPAAARSGLEKYASLATQPPQNATVRLEGEALVAVPALPGAAVDIEKAQASLASDPYGVLFQGYLVLPVQPVAPRITDVSRVISQAEHLLAAAPPIRAYDPVTDEHIHWDLSREVVAGWIVVQEGEDGPEITLDANRISAYLASLGDTLGPDRWLDIEGQSAALAADLSQGKSRPLIVHHRPTTYTVQSGDTLLRIGWNVGMPYWKLLEANPGLDEKSLRVGQTLIVPSKDELLPLPVVPDKRIVISISEQRMWTYQDGKQRSEYVISTGIDRSPTQPGIFQVRTHELEAYASVWDLYMPHFIGIYEAWPGFMNGIHGLPTLSSGVRLWANILGRPASYGCIILDLDDAENLYQWAEEGVVVEIQA